MPTLPTLLKVHVLVAVLSRSDNADLCGAVHGYFDVCGIGTEVQGS